MLISITLDAGGKPGDAGGATPQQAPYSAPTSLPKIGGATPDIGDEPRKLLAERPKRAHLTDISDSCFSAGGARAAVGEVISGLGAQNDWLGRLLCSSLRGEKILETPWKAKLILGGGMT